MKSVMDYNGAVTYITEALKFGINPGLEKIEAVCSILGNPQLDYRTIQITGTNGKTSTTWMTHRLLSEAGFKVGSYTSPHLHSYRERISVDGKPIPEEDFVSTLEAIKYALEQVRKEFGELTEFEILTAMAIYYFSQAEVDVAVFEVGLGGRWDATSVVKPTVAVITGISLDHTDRLGETIEEIAWDKAHIIKEGSRPVLGDLPERARKVIEERCILEEASPVKYADDYSLSDIEVIRNIGSRFNVSGIYGEYPGIMLPVFGEYQASNFAVAIATCETFLGTAIKSETIRKATQELRCPGRFELVMSEPLVVLDGAHNPEGMQMVADGLPKSFKFDKLHIVLAISSDKDIDRMIQILSKKASTMVLTQNKSYRSASPEVLADIALRLGNRYSIEPDLTNAIERVLACATVDDLVCITGSLYTVADAREIIVSGNV